MHEVRVGDCMMCGKCCRLFPIDNKMPEPRFVFQGQYLSQFGDICNFERANGEITYSHFIRATCEHLGLGNKCLIWQNRPQICRDYPFSSDNPLYRYLKAQGVKCGYEFEVRTGPGTVSQK